MERKVGDKFFSRFDSLASVPKWLMARALVFGAGSMGSPVICGMARTFGFTAPVGHLGIVDSGTVKPEVLSRTIYEFADIERPKDEAAADHAIRINPDMRVSTWHRHVTSRDVPEFRDIAEEFNLVCHFQDSFDVAIELADAIHDQVPQLMAVFGPNCDYAEVAYSIPGVTARLSETMGDRPRQRIDGAQALGCDTAYVTSFVTSVALQMLLQDIPSDHLPKLYSNAPLYVAGLRREWIFENMPRDQERAIFLVGNAHQSTKR